MRIVVTGGSGFIGSHLIPELRRSGHAVFNFDSKNNWVHNLRNPEAPKRIAALKPDVVIHLAAKVGRLFGEDDVQETIVDNAGMTAAVAQVCGQNNIRLLYASTSEVYGDWDTQLCCEDDPFTRVPHNMYGLSKRWGEEACRLYAPEGLTIMRFSMPYGPGLPAGRGRAALINFLYSALHLEPLTVHRGSERSWCWIGDTVRAVRMLLELTDGGAFNIGRDDNAMTMREVAEMCCDLTGSPYELIEEVDPPVMQTVVKRLSMTKIRDLGWTPRVELEEGMERCLSWVRAKYPIASAA